MKQLAVICLFLCCAMLGAATLLNETFSSALPAGWTPSGSANNHWSHSATSNAGGAAAGELKFSFSPTETGTLRYISPMFDTSKVYDMTLNFRHMVDWFSSSFTLSVQISRDLSTWSTVWTTTPTGNISAANVNVTIPFAQGMSATTYLAFVFSGNTNNIDYWYVDDISLTYVNSLGSGTWQTMSHYPEGDLIIPDGHTLTLNAGTGVFFDPGYGVQVRGRLLVNGTASNNVRFSEFLTGQGWSGINLVSVGAANDSTLINYAWIEKSSSSGFFVSNFSKVRLSNCLIESNQSASAASGGGIYCANSNIVVENCYIENNSASNYGSGADFYNCSPTLRDNVVYYNQLNGGLGALALRYCNLNNVTGNKICNNIVNSGESAVYLLECSGGFRRNLIANNHSHGLFTWNTSSLLEIVNCDVVYNQGRGISVNYPHSIRNCIIWGNGSWEIYNGASAISPEVRFNCLELGFSNLENVAYASYIGNISANPLFMAPTTANGIAQNGLAADWTLQDFSPCIDAGDYLMPLDDDFSNPDIGMHTRRLKPTLIRAADVAPDQGHQIDLRWLPNDKDVAWDPAAWYHVFRSVTSRADYGPDALLVTDPRQITPDLAASNHKILWQQGDRTLYFLGQVKAMMREDYGLIVPTLRDSSATGTHGEVFVVTYLDSVYFWDSVGLYGYSVDNIPPLSPERVELTRLSGSRCLLSWDEVTEGAWEGNSYPETNAIVYKVYASDFPGFEPGPASYLLSTDNPSAILTGESAPRRFYRIVASDSD